MDISRKDVGMEQAEVKAGERYGTVTAPPSKSDAHRLLILAALSDGVCRVKCPCPSDDVLATASCLSALGMPVTFSDGCFTASGRTPAAVPAVCDCGESGSTLRFLIPLAGALGTGAVFVMRGRLPSRPLEPFESLLASRGMIFSRDGNRLFASGKLRSGSYSIRGDVSSQYITGLLLSLPLLSGDSTLEVTGRIESGGYIAMTEEAMRTSGVVFEKHANIYKIPGGQRPALPPFSEAGGDWSGAAFFLCAGALSEKGITVLGLRPGTKQGDAVILDILASFGAEVSADAGSVTVKRGKLRGITLDASGIPDLIPVVSVVASVAEGVTVIKNAGRLRLKESDRLAGTAALIRSLGGGAGVSGDDLIITGKKRLHGGTADSLSDHRLAMSAAVAAFACERPVTVTDPSCVAKSYPGFWDDLESLKGV